MGTENLLDTFSDLHLPLKSQFVVNRNGIFLEGLGAAPREKPGREPGFL